MRAFRPRHIVWNLIAASIMTRAIILTRWRSTSDLVGEGGGLLGIFEGAAGMPDVPEDGGHPKASFHICLEQAGHIVHATTNLVWEMGGSPMMVRVPLYFGTLLWWRVGCLPLFSFGGR